MGANQAGATMRQEVCRQVRLAGDTDNINPRRINRILYAANHRLAYKNNISSSNIDSIIY
jgi:hypothetical protein